jgi:hypothetical protein
MVKLQNARAFSSVQKFMKFHISVYTELLLRATLAT